MKIMVSAAAFLLAVSCSSSPRETCRVEPAVFCEPFAELAEELTATEKDELMALPKDQYIRLHFGLGLTVRNQFGLWSENELTKFFRLNGINHPDDMSTPFIGGFVEYLRGEDVNMTKATRTYRVAPPPPPPPRSS